MLAVVPLTMHIPYLVQYRYEDLLMTIDWKKIQSYLEKLAVGVQAHIAPLNKTDAWVGEGTSGDLVSKADHAAAKFIRDELMRSCPVPCALMDEDSAQLVPMHPDPVIGIIADQIDGTRPLIMHMPLFTTTVAAFELQDEPALSDIMTSVIQTASDEQFSFVKGQGVKVNQQLWQKPRAASPNLKDLRIHLDFAGGIPSLGLEYVAPFHPSYLKGFTVMNSTGYGISRLLTGGLHCHIHIGARLKEQWPELESISSQGSYGVTGLNIWDIAASVPLLLEAGMSASTMDGRSLDDAALDDSPPPKGYHLVAAVDETTRRTVVDILLDQESRLTEDRQATIDRVKYVYDNPS